eukprot:s163_g3.t1
MEPAGNRHRRSDRSCAALLCVVPTSEINLLRRLCGGKDPLLRVFLRTPNSRCFCRAEFCTRLEHAVQEYSI